MDTLTNSFNGSFPKPAGDLAEAVSKQHASSPLSPAGLGALPFARPANAEWASQIDRRLSDRIDAQINGCWLWTGATVSCGYGQINRGGRKQMAHRYMYIKLRGEIPGNLECDHLCWVRRCVNPNHIDLVDHKTNKRRQLLSIVVALRHMRNLVASSDNVRFVPLKLNATYSECNSPRVASGVMVTHKSCLICREVKPFSEFYTIRDEGAKGQITYPSSYCKPCHKARTTEDARKRRAKQKELRNV